MLHIEIHDEKYGNERNNVLNITFYTILKIFYQCQLFVCISHDILIKLYIIFMAYKL